MEIFTNAETWASMLRIATPLTLAAMGGLLCQKAGIFNIALEGFMLIGAFSSIAVVHFCGGNVWIGMLGAMAISLIYSGIFGLSVVKFKADQIISGIAMNMLSLGLTSYLIRTMFSVQGAFRPASIDKLTPISIPVVESIPVIGKIVSGQSVVVYIAILFVIAVFFILNKTELGLNICAVGESEDAAGTAGINTAKIRWIVILTSGALCGLAGAYLSTTIVSQFSENMVQGRGFNAFTAVVFGQAQPIATWLVTLLFGLADAIGIRLELMNTGISPSIVKMFPYVLALIALAISSYSNKLRRLGKLGGKRKKSA